MSESLKWDMQWLALDAAKSTAEFFMRADPGVHTLIDNNPAFYAHLFCEPVKWSAIVGDYQVPKKLRSKNVEYEYTATGFDLKKYTGLSTVPMGAEHDLIVRPHDYFWEVHVDTTRIYNLSPIEKIRRVQEEIVKFVQLHEPDGAEHLTPRWQSVFALTQGSLFIGSISHLGRLIELFAPEYCWDASTTLPHAILQIYTKRMQMAVDNAEGTRKVAVSDLRSAVLSQHFTRSNIRG